MTESPNGVWSPEKRVSSRHNAPSIYTEATRPHTNNNNPSGINALWGDTHVSFSNTKAAFGPKLWDRGQHHVGKQNPGDNPSKFRTIVGLLRP